MLLMLVLRPVWGKRARDAGPGANGLAADAPDAGSFPGFGAKGQKGWRLMLLMLVLRPVWGKRARG